jgi:hypothetical protein
MGVGRIGRTRPKPGPQRTGADRYPRPRTREKPDSRKSTRGHRMVGLILVAIIAVGFVVGWMRAF